MASPIRKLLTPRGALDAKAMMKWSETMLDKWLKNPSSFAPGNAMAFNGISSAKDRKDLIAYLKMT